MKPELMNEFIFKEGENPLDNLPSNGGFCSIFRSIAFIGDSLSSGEFESMNKEGQRGYHDMFEYSWGQYIGRMCGLKAYNMSRGGMTAAEYMSSWAKDNDFLNVEAQAYVIALGVNDISAAMNGSYPFGEFEDCNFEEPEKSKESFTGQYFRLLMHYKKVQPRGKFFLVTTATETCEAIREEYGEKLQQFLYFLAEKLQNVYVIDLRKYAPVYDDEFKKKFFMLGHMNPMGYVFTARIISAYIDWHIRKNPEEFKEVPYIGTELTSNP